MTRIEGKEPAAPRSGDVRADLFHFFKDLKDRGIIRGVVKGLGSQLSLQLTSREQLRGSAKSYKAATFKNFDVSTVENCKAGLELCAHIREVLPGITFPNHYYGTVNALHEHYFGGPMDTPRGNDFWLFRKQGHREMLGPQGEKRFDGDYLLYRIERRRNLEKSNSRDPSFIDRVSVNFVRFYAHHPRGTRFMMLSTAPNINASATRYLGAKGWVDDVGDAEVCVGQIVSRDGELLADEQVYGGMTSLTLEARETAPFTKFRRTAWGYTVEATPCIYMRAVFGQEPSVGRGYLVRCHGAKELGGERSQTPAQRYIEIRELQARLHRIFLTELRPIEIAKTLREATGFPAATFYEIGGDGQPHGLLINLPFREQLENHLQHTPLSLPTQDSYHRAKGKRGKDVTDDPDFGVRLRL